MRDAEWTPLPLPVTASDRRARAARVSEIARQVRRGTYRVDPALVAESVEAFHRREV